MTTYHLYSQKCMHIALLFDKTIELIDQQMKTLNMYSEGYLQ